MDRVWNALLTAGSVLLVMPPACGTVGPVMLAAPAALTDIAFRANSARESRTGGQDGAGAAPLIIMLHCSTIRLELLHCTINRRPP